MFIVQFLLELYDDVLGKIIVYQLIFVELEWFKSYLTKQTQRTKVSNVLSDVMEVGLGVPQGAVLGTLLFIIYINDLENVLYYAKARLFVDDTFIYVTGSSVEECINRLNTDLKNLELFFKMN